MCKKLLQNDPAFGVGESAGKEEISVYYCLTETHTVSRGQSVYYTLYVKIVKSKFDVTAVNGLLTCISEARKYLLFYSNPHAPKTIP